MNTAGIDWLAKLRAAGLHGLLSLTVAGFAALLVFGLWYPAEYKYMAGGLSLFILLTSVDVVLGPILTFAVWNQNKATKHLVLDLFVIGSLQTIALIYGLWTVAQARPVLLAAENQMFRLVTAQDIKYDELARTSLVAPPSWWLGPQVVGTRVPANGDEKLDSVLWALKGFDVGTRPSYWVPFRESWWRAIGQAAPFPQVFDGKLAEDPSVQKWIGAPRSTQEHLVVLPIQSKEPGWYVVMDRQDPELLGFVRKRSE